MTVLIEIIVRDTEREIAGWRTWQLRDDLDADVVTAALFADLDEIGESQ